MQPVMIVTGGSQGTGAKIARLAGARGYAVALTYQTPQPLADAVVAKIRASGGRAIAVQAEMANEASIIALFRRVDAELGPVTVLVNNAFTRGPEGTIDSVTAAVLDEVLAVNVRAPFLLIREAVARMATDRGGAGGAIVNVSTRPAEMSGANEWIQYAASRSALDNLTIGAAQELAPRGIRVNAVSPGWTQPDLVARSGLADRLERHLGALIGRVTSPDEVAHAVLWLASDEGSYVSGAILRIAEAR